MIIFSRIVVKIIKIIAIYYFQMYINDRLMNFNDRGSVIYKPSRISRIETYSEAEIKIIRSCMSNGKHEVCLYLYRRAIIYIFMKFFQVNTTHTSTCGVRKTKNAPLRTPGRIRKGVKAPERFHPWIGRLKGSEKISADSQTVSLCSATLIPSQSQRSSRYLITAAHCLYEIIYFILYININITRSALF